MVVFPMLYIYPYLSHGLQNCIKDRHKVLYFVPFCISISALQNLQEVFHHLVQLCTHDYCVQTIVYLCLLLLNSPFGHEDQPLLIVANS